MGRTARKTVKSTRRRTSAKVLASVVLVAGAAGVAGLGTFGSFTSSTAADQAVSTGTVTLTSAGQATRGLDVAATNLVPGDTVQRAVQLTRASNSETFGSVKLTTAASATNLLSTDATNGLKLKVDQCSVAWTKAAGSNELTCSGTTTNLVAQRAVIGQNLDLGAATTSLNSADKVANLRAELVLPTAADNTFKNLSTTITFTFDATQRTADFR
ncbi:TasA family protein [uncultured Nocardioides sp.]|uniref:TasA family protein n=1 Tax=uncultured Nocardioides sp. TaxID=198441 RepID=UPI0026069BF4|nr:TasA family protein [uncultured Nocardioides sp.]